MWKLAALLIFTTNAVYQQQYQIDTANVSDTLVTNQILAKRDPGLCDCDLTSNSCDAYCCCDWDCRDYADNWRSQSWCLDEKSPIAAPLLPCLSVSEIRQYNREQGEFSYAGPISQLFCVAYDHYPPANDFYVDIDSDSVDQQEINDILATSKDFSNQLFTILGNRRSYFGVGNGLKGRVSNGGNIYVSHFPSPQPLSSGLCDYNKPALFLEPTDSVCTGQLDLSSNEACLGPKFNSDYWYSPILQLFTRADSTSAGNVDVTLETTHQKLNSDGTLTDIADTDITASTYDGTTCGCSNHVSEVHYTISYEAREDAFLHPSGATVKFILADTTGDCASVQQVNQRFVVDYQISGSTNVVELSGSPGYHDELPVLLGTRNGDSISRVVDGFKLSGKSNAAGECLNTNIAVDQRYDSAISFNVNKTVSCMHVTNTEAEF